MSKINLVSIAKQVHETYEDVKTAHGPVRVYHVPDAVRWALKPDWEPGPAPTVEMKLAGGHTQHRPAKQGDAGFSEHKDDLKRYEDETNEIQFAARYVLALRDVEYPADLSKPPENVASYVNGEYPPASPHDVRRKFFWLTTTLLAKRGDINEVFAALERMNTGVTDDMVDEVKKSSASTTKEGESAAEAEV